MAVQFLQLGVALLLCGHWSTYCRAAQPAAPARVVLAIHGGCGVIPQREMPADLEREYRQALETALQAGYAELQKPQGASLDAVAAAIQVMEDSPLFNAGKGAVFTHDGRNELDASIMDGATKKAGAVAGVTTVKNPILAARAVMDKTWHVLLVGPGADEFAREAGLEIVEPSYFRTEKRWQEYQRAIKAEQERAKPKEKTGALDRAGAIADDDAPAKPDHRLGTVGAVALDRRGNLAAGTSTGGLSLKRHGRVGDSPIIGAGTYADNRTCAVSATGDGEYFIRAAAAHDISALVEYKSLPIAKAADLVIQEKIKQAGGEGAVIVLDPQGNVAISYNTDGMYRGFVTSDGKTHMMIYKD